MITSSSEANFCAYSFDNYIMKHKKFLLSFVLCLLMFPAAAQSTERPTPVILEEISGLLAGMKFREAIALFDSINPEDAATTRIKLLKASVLNSVGNTGEARTITQAVISAEPENIEALLTLSMIEARAGRTRDQRTVLERILVIDPKNITALNDLALVLIQTRAFREAMTYYERTLEIDPDNLSALLGKATVYRYYRDPYNAELVLNQAVRSHPNQAAPYHERARLYEGAGFPIQALADLDKAKDLDPSDYWIALDRANILLDLFRKEQALAEFERAISLNPGDYLAYAFTAGIKDELGDYNGAEKDYETLARLKPDYYFAFEGVGLHKMRRGQWSEARLAFAEVYRQAPNEYCYALLTAANWMRADGIAAPRQFLNQAMTRVRRDSIEYYMLRLYYDLTGRVYNGENDMLTRVDRETNATVKARMLFYLAQYYDIRGNTNLANRYYQQFRQLEQRSLPEWRLNEWICAERGLLPL